MTWRRRGQRPTRYRAAATASVLLAALPAMACGGHPAVGPDEDTLIPLSWEPGDKIAVVAIERQTKDPLTLSDDRCGWMVQLAEAVEAGEVPRTDAEGPCIVTDASVELRTQPGLEPFCGGTIHIEAGGLRQTVTVCGDTIPDRMDLDCADVDADRTVTLTSRGAERPDDALGEGVLSVERGGRPDIMAPEPQGDGTAPWPQGEVLVGWGGVGAESVEIVLRERGGGRAVRCFVEDTGSFVLPNRLVEPYRGQVASLEVARVTQTRTEIDGVEVRLSARTSDAIWLFPPSRP